MKLTIRELALTFRQGTENLNFESFNFFHGKMGAGKSTIVRLIDYCLGGNLEMTPALQSEFVSATLTLTLNKTPLTLTRQRESMQVEAAWVNKQGPFHLVLPTRKAEGEVLPGTGVEVLSDLLFHLSGIRPPRVRKSKIREDSEMARLSFRDLYLYCYLDQANIDSGFYHLERDADQFRRLKSRDVLRFILGYHQERVSEMEAELEEARQRKFRAEEGARAMREALITAGIGSREEVSQQQGQLHQRLEELHKLLETVRSDSNKQREHAVEQLRHRSRKLSTELQTVEDAVASIERLTENDRRHRNELITLSMKFRRDADARAVLSQVEFTACPRCTQSLPAPQPSCCLLCHQPEAAPTAAAEQNISADINVRLSELDDVLERHAQQLEALKRDCNRLSAEKQLVDRDFNEASRRYDSAYLSSTLQLERERATVEQQIINLNRLNQINERRDSLIKEAAQAEAEASKIRLDLQEARAASERDTKNLRRLEELFLDCLLRSRLPGFNSGDKVSISAPSFFPEATKPGAENTLITSFAHLGSGGKKTLFKCCFAVAVHRLAAEAGATLPTLLIIDTAMKNISERENKDQFSGFYSMLYSLAGSELSDTQFIIVDKEFYPPPPDSTVAISHRMMTPDDSANPPLIPYYRGH